MSRQAACGGSAGETLTRESSAHASAYTGRTLDRSITLAVEIDGLVQRFGRLVPDTAALLDRIAVLRAQAGGDLKVVLVRFGADRPEGVASDIDSLGLGSARNALNAEIAALPHGTNLAGLTGRRTMLFGGSEHSVGLALATGLPAYVVSDRRLPDHRRLFLGEADRMIAEALRRPVPRPMSDETRTGIVLALEGGSAKRVRARGLELLRLDPRADWLQLGPRQVVYTEIEEVADRLSREGAQLVARDIHLGALAIGRLAEQAGGKLLVRDRKLGLGLFIGAGTRSWASVRRARIGTAAQEAPGTHTSLLSLQQHDQLLLGLVDGTVQVLDFPAALVYSGVSFDHDGQACVALPFVDDESETLAILVQTEACETTGAPFRAVASLALALRRCGDRGGLLLCSGETRSADASERVLWEQERSRLRTVVQIRQVSGAGPSKVTRVSMTAEQPLSLEVVLSEHDDAASIVAAQILQEISRADWLD